jgi:hypothetical protein
MPLEPRPDLGVLVRGVIVGDLNRPGFAGGSKP